MFQLRAFPSITVILSCVCLCAAPLLFAVEATNDAPWTIKVPGTPAITFQPVVSQEILIKLKPGTDAQAFAQARGLILKRTLLSDDTMHVLKASSERAANDQLTSLLRDNTVVAAYLNLPSRNVPMAFVPNDPYFQPGNPTGFPGQWHLVYDAQPQFSTHVQGAWNRDITGAGVIIGICDDGLQTTHPDLAPNYDADDSYDFAEEIRPKPSGNFG
jgi:hypothetical protein